MFLFLLYDKIIHLHWLRAATIAVVSKCHFEDVSWTVEFYFQIKLFCRGIKHGVHCGNWDKHHISNTSWCLFSSMASVEPTHRWPILSPCLSSRVWWTRVDSSFRSVIFLFIFIFLMQPYIINSLSSVFCVDRGCSSILDSPAQMRLYPRLF